MCLSFILKGVSATYSIITLEMLEYLYHALTFTVLERLGMVSSVDTIYSIYSQNDVKCLLAYRNHINHHGLEGTCEDVWCHE